SRVGLLIMSRLFQEPFLLVHPILDHRKRLLLLLRHIQVPFHPLFLSMSFVPIPTSHHYRYIFLCHFYHYMKHGNNNHRFQSLYTLFESILLRGQILTSIDRGERIYERHSASSPEHVAILPVHQTFRNGASCLILQYAQVSFGNCKADFDTPSCDVDSASVATVILRYPSP